MSDDLRFEKDSAIAVIHAKHGEILEALTGNATIQERDTWPIKERAGRALLDGSASAIEVAMLTAEAEMIGITAEQLAQTIVGKADAFKMLVARAAGLRSQGIASVEACLTPEQVEATVAHIESVIDAEVAAHS